jgi:hypothetical protein
LPTLLNFKGLDETFIEKQHYLPPNASTRSKTRDYIVPVKQIDLDSNVTERKKRRFENVYETQQENIDSNGDIQMLGSGLTWESYIKRRNGKKVKKSLRKSY